ncbi:MAG: quinoprotein amine dehydrogenase, beta chain-like protein, partial [Gammaproteobacteria bacterium]|nr:quinoprotein amine dehydrogenase, beta chain-like protein [Gammaproteobacteria bacterium]
MRKRLTAALGATCGLGLALGSGFMAALARPIPNDRDVGRPVTIDPANRPTYTHILPTGRVTSPVGRINGTPNFATAAALSGHDLLVLANGATRAQTITSYDAHSLARIGQMAAYRGPHKGAVANAPSMLTLGHQNLFQGLATASGGLVYAAGGATNDVLVLRQDHGRLTLVRRYPLAWQPFPKTQYPYHYQGHHIGRPRLFYPDAVLPGPRGRHLYVTGLLANSLARITLKTGHVRYLNIGAYPYALAFADHGHRLAVSLWGANAVAIVNPRPFTRLDQIQVGPRATAADTAAGLHPTAMIAKGHGPDVFVTLANVDRVAQIDTVTGKVVRWIDDSPYPDAPPGSYPDALAIAGERLFVANAGNNDVAVFDLRSGQRVGLIPTGWYPTALTATAHALYIVAAKGLGSGPNIHHQWVGDMMDGLVQKVSFSTLATRLPQWTRLALRHDGFTHRERMARVRGDRTAIAFLHRHIHYVVFILR